jgi:hypothetical protein
MDTDESKPEYKDVSSLQLFLYYLCNFNGPYIKIASTKNSALNLNYTIVFAFLTV